MYFDRQLSLHRAHCGKFANVETIFLIFLSILWLAISDVLQKGEKQLLYQATNDWFLIATIQPLGERWTIHPLILDHLFHCLLGRKYSRLDSLNNYKKLFE